MPIGDQLSDGEQPPWVPRWQASEAPIVLRLLGEIGKESRQQPSDRPRELPVGNQARDGLGDRKRDQLLVGDLPGRTRARSRQRTREYVACDNEGLQRSVHLVLQSRVDRAGGPLLISKPTSCPTPNPHQASRSAWP